MSFWKNLTTDHAAAYEAHSKKLVDRLTASDEVVRQLTDVLSQINTHVNELQLEVSQLKEQLASAPETTEDTVSDRYNSSEPWVEVVGDQWNDVHGLQINLDWNDAFVAKLRELGYTGKDDATVVHKWLALLYEDVSMNLEEDVMVRDGEADQYV